MRIAGGEFLDEFCFGHIGEPDITALDRLAHSTG
jgi:hypothetical protein